MITVQCLLLLSCTKISNDDAVVKIQPPKDVIQKIGDSDASVSDYSAQVMGECKNSKKIQLEYCNLNAQLMCGTQEGSEYCVQYIDESTARVWGPY